MDNTFNLANTIKVVNPESNVDFYYGVWNSLAEAKSRVPQAVRKVGKTVGVVEDGEVLEYWWNTGTADSELVLKENSAGIFTSSINVPSSGLILGDSTVLAQQIAFDINRRNPFTISKNEVPFFTTIFKDILAICVFQRKDVVAGDYGEGNNTVEAFQIRVISKEPLSTGSLEGGNTETIDVGDIGSQEIWEFVSAKTPPYTLQDESEAYTIFRAEQNGSNQAWLYSGDTGPVGIGVYEPTEEDFSRITDEELLDYCKWEADTATTIRPKEGKKIDVNVIENLPSFGDLSELDTVSNAEIDDDAVTEPKLSPEVRTKLNESVGSGGYAGNVYFTNLDSINVPAYKQLSYSDDNNATTINTVVNDNEVLIQNYIFNVDLDTNQIPSGLWVLNSFVSTTASQGITKLRYEVFKRTVGGTETILFTFDSREINNSIAEMVASQIFKPAYDTNETDRLGIKIYANTTRTSNVTVTFQVGNGNGSYVTTPLQTIHSQLRGRDEVDSHPISAITNLESTLVNLTDRNSIENIEDNGDGTLTFTYIDATTFTTPSLIGPKGDDGNDGSVGDSAYDVWLANGNTGTVQDYLDSLIGEKGDIGDSAYNVWLSLGNTGTEQDFIDSIKGEDGAIGSDGADGDSAYQVWLNAGNTGSQQDFIDSLTGPQGPKGNTGNTGPQGIQGETGQDGEDATKDPIPFKTLTSPANEIDFAGDNLELYNWNAPTSEISFTLTNLRAGVQRIIRVQNATAVASEVLINGDGSSRLIGSTDNWDTNQIMEISIFGLSTTDYEWWYNRKQR